MGSAACLGEPFSIAVFGIQIEPSELEIRLVVEAPKPFNEPPGSDILLLPARDDRLRLRPKFEVAIWIEVRPIETTKGGCEPLLAGSWWVHRARHTCCIVENLSITAGASKLKKHPTIEPQHNSNCISQLVTFNSIAFRPAIKTKSSKTGNSNVTGCQWLSPRIPHALAQPQLTVFPIQAQFKRKNETATWPDR